VSADFSGASPVASALGIRSGATPCGQSIAVTATISRKESYNGRWYWLLAREPQPFALGPAYTAKQDSEQEVHRMESMRSRLDTRYLAVMLYHKCIW
jgi:hypothetical protein